ncbi:hypothetical protein [Saccharothrix xinjiangensis]|uniref:Neocarzinostatin family protein n=1 Tax=Saccharothrix xinjiangensis TaxID=204798 RepID=A0ABV9XXY3_9PSEU
MLKKVGALTAATALTTLLLQAPGEAAPAEAAFVGGSGTSALGTGFGFAVFPVEGEGGKPTGFALFRNTAEGVEERLGGVTCVNVVGNAAIFKIKDVGSEGGTHRQFFVRDNGPTGEGEPTDELSAYGVPSNEAPDKCDKPGDDVKGKAIKEGDVVITAGEE